MEQNSSSFLSSIHQANEIRNIAQYILHSDIKDEAVIQTAKTALSIPINYMRWAEFTSINQLIELNKGEKLLDVGSPQWYSLSMAKLHPENYFVYINILPEEINPFENIAKHCNIKNITYKPEDVRELSFLDCVFDKIISISAIEHVYPEVGGDVTALTQMKRVLKSRGKIYLTIPYKEKHGIVYKRGAVYERTTAKENFYAREYDQHSFTKLLEDTSLTSEKSLYIHEEQGIFALDYYSYGPGQSTFLGQKRKKIVRLLDSIFNLSLIKRLAMRYLHISEKPLYRLVNISVELTPTTA
ncbi:MAG: methyltransferase domain-containing protein [Bacteroidota bacterium]